MTNLDSMPVGVVGAGRLGTALAAGLRQAGFAVDGPAGRDRVPAGEAVVLCVPDGEIPAAAEALAGRARFVGHTSGATSLAALASAGGEAFGLHPLQTFTPESGPEAFRGVGCAVAGSTPQALGVAEALARRLGMRPLAIEDEQRAGYHAAASLASNYLVALQAAAEQVATGAGLEPDEARELLAPLVRRTAQNHAELGSERALTGPVARGDEATVERQREAVELVAPELLPLFDELTEQARRIAGRTVGA